jgi:TonB-linked SusC/RagA family outer membrane protein
MIHRGTWLVFTLALGLSPAGLGAQTTITGRVLGPSLLPVSGALVSIPELQLSTLTNDAGLYRLVVPAERVRGQEATLRIGAIGHTTRELSTPLSPGAVRRDVTLPEQAIALDAVVVTGTAGTGERRAQPAVVAVIDAAELVQVAPVTNLPEILQSRTPGVSVTPSSGSSGEAQRIRVRGAASISLTNEPLVFIDGVRADSRNQANNANGGQASSRLFDLNPEDIERVEIVKGPAAATLYGADASAGVIQVITKRGRVGAGRLQQGVTLEYGGINANWVPPSNFARCRAVDVAPESPNPLCRGQAVGSIVEDNPLLRERVLRSGQLRSLAWSARGGGDTYGYYVSLSSDEEEGTLPQNGFERRSGRTNFNFVPHPKVSFDAGLGLVRSVTDLPQNNDNPSGFLSALLGSPLTVGRAHNGWFAPNRDSEAIAGIIQRNTVLRATPTLQIRYTLWPWFTHRLTVGADLSHSEGRLFFPKNDRGWYSGSLNGGFSGEDRVHYDTYTADYLGNLNTAFGPGGELSGDLSFGLQLVDRRNDYLEALGTGLVTNAARAVGAAAERTGFQSSSQEKAIGFLGQGQLGYRNRAFLQLGARVDQNSSFGEAADPYLLPKLGLSYVLSEESFWRPHVPFVNTLRLRAAYGTTGRSPAPGAALQSYRPAPYVLAAGQTGQGVYPLSPGNKALRPEKGTEFEAGFDAGFFRDRLGVEFTFFNKVTKDLLLRRPLPPSMGFPLDPFANIGEVLNRGIELAVQAQLVSTPSFAWEARLGASTLHNELVSLGEVAPFELLYFRFLEGRPPGALYSQRIRKIDLENEVAIVSDTAEFVGNPLPTFEGNLATNATFFRNIRVYGHLDWKTGHKLHNVTHDFRERAFTSGERRVKMDQLPAAERLRRFGRYVTESGEPANASGVAEPYMEDGDFLRLRELSVTLGLPERLAGHIGAAGASLMLAGRNLGLWTRYGGGDPEVVTYVSGGGLGEFFQADFLTLPQPRRWVVRLNFQF